MEECKYEIKKTKTENFINDDLDPMVINWFNDNFLTDSDSVDETGSNSDNDESKKYGNESVKDSDNKSND